MIYLDNSATTKPYPEVLDSYIKVSGDFFGNPSSIHSFGGQAERLLLTARKQVAELLHVKPGEIFFTSGGTEGNNLAVKGTAHARKKKGMHIITTAVEHPSVEEACESLKEEGFEITYVPVNQEGTVSVADIAAALREDTILVSVMHVNNEAGSIQPVQEIGKLLKNWPNALFHVDHVQGICKVPLSLSEANIDLCTVSGHKFHGLKGTGFLYVREGVRIQPLFSGGNQESRLRSGTENVAGAVALAKALRMTMDAYSQYYGRMKAVHDILFEGIKKMDGIQMNSTPFGAPHIINFSLPGIKTEVFIHALEKEDIYLSTTSACSSKKRAPSKTIWAMFSDQERAESVVRISLSYQNGQEEAELALNAIRRTVSRLEKVMR
ncbi:cysteine desulfurase family protein [Bacillus massiliglaciei]|uniref:cysteine desulfurase family protein n=1 Tax=Bacillus massiliglaciei TaxID=1816693 RepID=UPI000B1321B5|nr:cysteine desulfurase family protein [Bacillus massiliglaciei]